MLVGWSEQVKTFCTFFLALSLIGCYEPPQTEAEWRTRDDVCSITVNSNPSGADVYGISGNSLGAFLGTTPLTLHYYIRYPTYSDPYLAEIYCANCGDILQTLIFDSKEPMFAAECKIIFKCAVAMEGYKTETIYELVSHDKGLTGCDYRNFVGRRSFTANLQPNRPPQPVVQQAPQQQQQQQQQQMIVVPPQTQTSSSSAEKGLVSVMCEIEGAEVYVDGGFVGNVPANLKLKEGIHIIEVKRKGYQSYRKELKVFEDSELNLRVELEKE